MGTGKKRYIELYGEEAWEIESKRRNEKRKQYRDNHKEQIAEYQKNYYQSHREELNEKSRQYRQEHKEELNEKSRQYRREHKKERAEQKKQYYQSHKKELNEKSRQYQQEHKEELAEQKKQHYQEHKKEKVEYQKQYRRTLMGRANGLLNAYHRTDKTKNQKCDLTPEWIIENIFTSKCYYCGDPDWEHLGCDRIDNTKGHTMDNCICACGVCNMERNDNYTVEEFKRYRQLHPRDCDIPKTPILNENGCVAKKTINRK